MEKEKQRVAQFRHRRTKKGTISHKLQGAKRNARKNGYEFTLTNAILTELWERQEGRCALTGAELGYIGSGFSAASIDRIDPRRGYTADNIQWVCWRANDAKSAMTNDDFLTMCAAVAATHYVRK